MEVYYHSEENLWDTYMSREVPIPEGDDAQILTQEEIGQDQEDHCWFSHESTYTTSVFLKDTKDVLIPWPSYLKGRNRNMTLRNQLKNVKIQNAETVQS